MKKLLTITAIIEMGTGIFLVFLPSVLTSLLMGVSIDSPVGLTVASVAGIAVIALACGCWFCAQRL
jgi:hypothetical protein